jgi:hypothetical protein
MAFQAAEVPIRSRELHRDSGGCWFLVSEAPVTEIGRANLFLSTAKRRRSDRPRLRKGPQRCADLLPTTIFTSKCARGLAEAYRRDGLSARGAVLRPERP